MTLVDHILRATFALAIVFAGVALLLGGVPVFVGSCVGSAVALGNAFFFRWLFGLFRRGAMLHRSALMSLVVLKLGLLTTLCYAAIAKWGVHPGGFALGYGALVAGSLIGAGLLPTTSSLVREET